MPQSIDNEDLLNEAWSKFNEKITSNEDAVDAIFQSLLQDNKINCGCSNPQIIRQKGARWFNCLTCKREVWFIAGTLFSGVSLLRAWLAAVYFKEWGVTVSSLRLSRLLGIAQSTALNINKKVAIAIASQMDETAQAVDAKRLSQVIFRRSRHTPADQHPRSEIEDSPFPEPDPELDQEINPEPDLSNNPRRKKNLTNFPAASSTRQLTLSMLISAAITFIRKYFHGVSHKYLQIYLAMLWCHFDRETWSEGAVLRACLKHPPISYLDLLHYEAPELRMMLM